MRMLLVCLMLLLAGNAKSQTTDPNIGRTGMEGDSVGFVYKHEVNTTGSGATLNKRLTQWMNKNLNGAEIFEGTADSLNRLAADTIKTTAYIMLADAGELQNQFVSYNFAVAPTQGQLSVKADGFIYHGMNKTTGQQYDVPFQNLNDVGEAQKQPIYDAFNLQFNKLMKSLDASFRSRR